jgi:hypothetical protein
MEDRQRAWPLQPHTLLSATGTTTYTGAAVIFTDSLRGLGSSRSKKGREQNKNTKTGKHLNRDVK